MPKVKKSANNHDNNTIRLVVFSKYTMEVMKKSTLFN